MNDHTTQSEESFNRQAWERWFEADYSWAGLLKAEKETPGYASLQAYWRKDPITGEIRGDRTLRAQGELIEVEIEENTYVYHIAHLPLYYDLEQKYPTRKITDREAVQAKLDEVIYARLRAAATDSDHHLEIARVSAPLQGVVFLDLRLSSTDFTESLNALFNLCVFAGTSHFNKAIFVRNSTFDSVFFFEIADFNGTRFQTKIDFHKAIFKKEAYFKNAIFEDWVRFENATFQDKTYFDNANFRGWTRFQNATFKESAHFKDTGYDYAANFSETIFHKNADFMDCTFKGKAYFKSTVFQNSASFKSATFREDATFEKGICRDGEFSDATFRGKADFQKVIFRSSAHFENAVFESVAGFDNTTFERNAIFKKSIFKESANFMDSAFKYWANFEDVLFQGMANFKNLDFRDWTNFNNVLFQGTVNYTNSTFQGSTFFNNTTFQAVANFPNTTFKQTVSFENAILPTWASFESASFHDSACFDHAIFNGSVTFHEALFISDLSLNAAVFIGTADFRASTRGRHDVPPHQALSLMAKDSSDQSLVSYSGELSPPSGYTVQQMRALPRISVVWSAFLDEADFSNRDITSASSFNLSHFYGPTAFHGSQLHSNVTFLKANFESALLHSPRDIAALPPIPRATYKRLYQAYLRTVQHFDTNQLTNSNYADWKRQFDQERKKSRLATLRSRKNAAAIIAAHKASIFSPLRKKAFRLALRIYKFCPQLLSGFKLRPPKTASELASLHYIGDNYYAHLEAAFRTLKLIMENRRDRESEGQLFALELKARNRRSDIHFSIKIASALYGLTSRYGQSILRPKFGMGILVLSFAILYWGLFTPFGNFKDDGLLALTASFSRIFPFGAFGETSKTYVDYINQVRGPWWALLYMCLGTLESFMGLVMAFLFGLALRRRFQIN